MKGHWLIFLLFLLRHLAFVADSLNGWLSLMISFMVVVDNMTTCSCQCGNNTISTMTPSGPVASPPSLTRTEWYSLWLPILYVFLYAIDSMLVKSRDGVVDNLRQDPNRKRVDEDFFVGEYFSYLQMAYLLWLNLLEAIIAIAVFLQSGTTLNKILWSGAAAEAILSWLCEAIRWLLVFLRREHYWLGIHLKAPVGRSPKEGHFFYRFTNTGDLYDAYICCCKSYEDSLVERDSAKKGLLQGDE